MINPSIKQANNFNQSNVLLILHSAATAGEQRSTAAAGTISPPHNSLFLEIPVFSFQTNLFRLGCRQCLISLTYLLPETPILAEILRSQRIITDNEKSRQYLINYLNCLMLLIIHNYSKIY